MQLCDATVQDIQLELIRRTKFNGFDGERVCELLQRYRDRWTAVLLDRPGIPNYSTPGRLLMGGLIKLRDLGDNIWNADTLYVLTPSVEHARELAAVVYEEAFSEQPTVYDELVETDMALGTGRQKYGLFSAWWD